MGLISDALVVLQDGRYQIINSAFTKLFGYTRHDVDQGLSFFNLVQDKDKEAVRQQYEDRLAGKQVPQTFRIDLIAKDGTIVLCETSATVIEYARRPADLVLIRDISERVHTEDTLRESEAEYRELFENMLEGVYRTLPNGTIIKANPAMVEMLGYDSEEELRTSVHASDLYSSPHNRLDLIRTLEREGELRIVEILLRRKDGRQITALEDARVVRDTSGKVLYYEGMLTDITERKRAEQTVQDLAHILERSLNEIYIFDAETFRFNQVNYGARENIGYTAEELTKMTPVDIKPEFTKESFIQLVEPLKSGAKDITTFETVHERKDGSLYDVEVHLQLSEFLDKPVFVAIILDITERKQAEEKLHATHEQLQATLNALPDLLFEIDYDGRVYYVHAPHPELLYCPPEEFLGKRMGPMLPKHVSDIVMKSVRQVKDAGRSQGATYSLEIGGEERWFELSMAAKGDLRNPEDRIIALVRDITDRKLSVEKLRETTEDLEIEHKELTEKNIALKQILEHIESQKQSHRQQVCSDMEEAIIPAVTRLKKKIGPEFAGEFENLETAIAVVLSKDIEEHVARYSKLTSRESEICDMIKAGMSSKQIADSLNLSLATVLKHREHARKKLGITGKKLSLSTYLRSH